MTTGAIYGNFKNRDELFIALGQAYWAPVKPRVKPGATFAEVMHAMAEATLEAIPERTTAAVGRLTGLAYALTSPDLRERVREVTAGSYEFGAEWLRALGDERDLPMPPEQLVRVIHALIEGLVLQRILTPELCPTKCSSRPSGRWRGVSPCHYRLTCGRIRHCDGHRLPRTDRAS